MSDWDESLHPRATDGKFGAGSGHAGKEALGKAMAAKGATARGARAAKSPVLPGAPMPAAAAAAPKAKKPRAKFDATEHDKAIAAAKTKEALIRMHSIKVKEHMAAAKANARYSTSTSICGFCRTALDFAAFGVSGCALVFSFSPRWRSSRSSLP